MKSLYNRFDTYLLTKWPLIWHSKIVYLLAAGLLMNGVFLIWGLASATTDNILNRNIDSIYGNGTPVFVHLILGLIFITLWAIQFYKKNAIKHLYPLGSLYLTKLFLLLLIGFTCFITPAESFNYGMRISVRQQYDLKTLQKDVAIVNKACVFLPQDEANYTLDKRTFPKPFPIEFVEYDLNEQSWAGLSAEFKGVYYSPTEHPENNDTIDGRIIQCYVSHVKPVKKECYEEDYEMIIDRFVDLPQDSSIAYTSLFNYSSYEFYPLELEPKNTDYYNYLLDIEPYGESDETTPSYIAEVHQLMRNRDQQGIENVINEAVTVFRKYEVENELPAEWISKYHIKHNFQLPNYMLIDTYLDEYEDFGVSNIETEIHIKEDQINEPEMIVGGYDSNAFSNLIDNVGDAYHYIPFPYQHWIYIMIGAILAMFFLIFEFSNILAFAISIPIGGAVLILNVLIAIFLDPSFSNELSGMRFISTILMVNAAVFLTLSLWSLSNGISKKIATIAVLFGYLIAPFIPIVSLFFLDSLFSSLKPDPCYEYSYDVEHSIFMTWMRPDISLIAGILVLACYFRVVRRYHAKAE